MAVRVLYFAWLRERVGVGEESLALPAGVGSLGALRDFLAERDAAHASAFAEPGCVRAAVNQAFAGPETTLQDGDEIAFFPPVTGG